MTPFIRFITVERFVKGIALIAGGIALLVLSRGDRLHDFAVDAQEQLNLNPGSGFWRHLYTRVAERLGNAGGSSKYALGVGAILYGVLETVEGIALVLRKRWAEYLVLLATGFFVPIEVRELVGRPSFLKAAALLVNVAIMAYLVWRKRLFLERPGDETDDAEREVEAS